ncbi:MAG: 4-alpha-glucanotransferase [Clostridia bacterium]|nr:4-alpha-glucanotransferase [Clostridia bacterium]
MPISSLPSRYGIGSFGRSAYKFIDFLSATGQRCWQVLPLNPTSYGDSPYQSPSSVAGNPYFIDLDTLGEEGLLTSEELKSFRHDTERVDYGWLFENRYRALRLAYSRFKPSAEYRRFLRTGDAWLSDYALFMALKVEHSYASWTSWQEEHRDYKKAKENSSLYEKEMGFWMWVQYEFHRGWRALLDYAHKKGILVIGDMPIYVAHDSMDVWANPEQFLLDGDYNPIEVAGCPPDGFSPDGQLWGNPIYNWERMEKEGFAWWLDRVGEAFKLYDILRIDHFRGFAGYYSIPYGDTTARGGRWNSAPGIELFRKVRKTYPRAKIIAEDLGFITDDVRELLRVSGFPGMKMLQFAFFEENNEYLPRTYTTKNCVVYPASHDSDCIRSWISGLEGEARARFNRECQRRVGQSRVYDLIELALGSIANLAVVPMQDYLALTNREGRMNTPSTACDNWTWRLSKRYDTPALRERITALVKRTKRG